MYSVIIPLIALLPYLVSASSPYVYYESIPDLHSETRSRARECGTGPPGERLRGALQELRKTESLPDNDLVSPETFHREILSVPSHKRDVPILFTVSLYFHVVSSESAAQPNSPLYVSPQQLQNQYDYLVTAFAPLAIGFSWDPSSTTRTVNPVWSSGREEYAMKSALRNGSFSALNIYFQSDLKDYDENGQPSTFPILGLCTLPLPNITAASTTSEYVYDGCGILSSSIKGGTTQNYNLGGTVVHEVGHWFGLLHTFEGETCDVTSWGDYVADTPQQKDSTVGCPARGSQDTCPTSGVAEGWNGGVGQGSNPYTQQGYSGPDNTRNWMDYSTDVCYESFTAGQGARVLNGWNLWRKGR